MKNNSRLRNWFLTVNKNADCYKHFDRIINGIDNCEYAYILHDKDESIENGEIKSKEEHIHAVLVFEHGHTFSAICKKFVGAHIEPCYSLRSVSEYLLHITKQSIRDGKKIYDISEVVTSNRTAFESWIGDKSVSFEVFNQDKIVDYILFDDLRCITSFYLRFGSSIQKFIPMIKVLLEELAPNRVCDDFGKRKEDKYIYPLGSSGQIVDLNVDYTSNCNDGYNKHSVNYTIDIGFSKIPLIDFIIKFNEWLYLDVQGLNYIIKNRVEVFQKLGINYNDFVGLDISFLVKELVNRTSKEY